MARINRKLKAKKCRKCEHFPGMKCKCKTSADCEVFYSYLEENSYNMNQKFIRIQKTITRIKENLLMDDSRKMPENFLVSIQRGIPTNESTFCYDA